MTEPIVSNFPSQFEAPEVKSSQQYCFKYQQAQHTESAYLPTETALCRNNKSYPRYRALAKGEQSQNQYKELTGLRRTKEKGGKGQGSYRNINYEILKFMPKIRAVLVNKIANQPLNLTAKPIDPTSLSKRRYQKSIFQDAIINKSWYDEFEKFTNLKVDRPTDGPETLQEVDPYMDMNPKDIVAMEVLDELKKVFVENDWEQLKTEIAGDLVDVGVGGTIQYLDVNNKIRFERIVPENCIVNKCVFPDFRDMIRFGQYFDMTVSELKIQTQGKWGEQAYFDIAKNVAGSRYNKGTRYQDYYEPNSYTYAYDHEKVRVLKSMWYSTDTEVTIEYVNEAGNTRVKQESPNYIPYLGDKSVNDGKGMSDEQYNTLNKGKKQIHRRQVRNVYKSSWVIDTEYVYDNGLMKNMLRPGGSTQETVMPVTLITTDFVSTIGLVEQPIDQVQLNYLQYQSHMAASKPPGIAIEKHALARLTKGIPGQDKWDPKENLIMYAETGNLLYDGYDKSGNVLNQKPFEQLTGGLPAGAQQHYEFMLQFVQLIRTMLGLNDLTEGQTPPERMGKSVAQLAFGASDNALSHLVKAYKNIFEKTARNCFYLLQNNIQMMNKSEMVESLGEETYVHFSLNSDIGLLDMGITLEDDPDQITKDGITQTLQLMVENGQLPGEMAILIQRVDNPYRQILMIKKARQDYEQKMSTQKQQEIAVQAQSQSQANMLLEQAKQQTAAQQHQFEMEKSQNEFMQKMAELKETNTTLILIEAMKLGAAANDTERKMINDYLGDLVKHQVEIHKENLRLQGKQKATATT